MKPISAARVTPLAGVGLAVVAAGSLLLFSLFAQNASHGMFGAQRGDAPGARANSSSTPITLPAIVTGTATSPGIATDGATGVTLDTLGDLAGGLTSPTPTVDTPTLVGSTPGAVLDPVFDFTPPGGVTTDPDVATPRGIAGQGGTRAGGDDKTKGKSKGRKDPRGTETWKHDGDRSAYRSRDDGNGHGNGHAAKPDASKAKSHAKKAKHNNGVRAHGEPAKKGKKKR